MRLDKQDHGSMVIWAADCAEHVLAYFEEKHPENDRPAKPSKQGAPGRLES